MKNKLIYFNLLIISFLFLSCNSNIEIKEIYFYDYVYSKDLNDAFGYKVLEHNMESTRIKGFLLKNIPKDLSVLENFLLTYTRELLSEDFIAQSEKIIFESQNTVNKKYIEIDFFRISKELPWQISKKYRIPYHLGEGNPKDWIGSILFDIDNNKIEHYWFAKRKKGIHNYGEIYQMIENYY